MKRVMSGAALALWLCTLGAVPEASAKVFGMTFGVKAGAGIELWTAPTGKSIPRAGGRDFKMPIFDDTRSGYNYAIGLYTEMRFIDYIGLEIGMNIIRHRLLEDTEWTYEVTDAQGRKTVYDWQTEEQLVYTAFHIPILLKGVLPVGDRVRLSLGIGPEISVGQHAFGRFYQTMGDTPQGERAAFKTLDAETTVDVFLVTAFSVDINAGDFRIPIDLRFGWNMTQPAGYYDRISYSPDPATGVHPVKGTFRTQDTAYFQLLVGIAFDLF